MATIVHMVPNKIYERLVDEGLLDQEFPSNKKSPVELVVETLPSTLKKRQREYCKH